MFWYFEYVCACVCMGICICKCGCIYVHLYVYSIFKCILHIIWTNQCLYKYICSSIVDMSIWYVNCHIGLWHSGVNMNKPVKLVSSCGMHGSKMVCIPTFYNYITSYITAGFDR